MSVKTSISLTDSQEAFARTLVAAGTYPSLSAVLQRGLDLLRADTELKAAELAALKALLDARRGGAFVSAEEGRARTARRMAAHMEATKLGDDGLSG